MKHRPWMFGLWLIFLIGLYMWFVTGCHSVRGVTGTEEGVCEGGYIVYANIDGCWSRKDVCPDNEGVWKCLDER